MENNTNYHFTSNDNAQETDANKAAHVGGAEKGSERTNIPESNASEALNQSDSKETIAKEEKVQKPNNTEDNNKEVSNNILFYCIIGEAILFAILFMITLGRVNTYERQLANVEYLVKQVDQSANTKDTAYQEKFRKIMDDLDDLDDKLDDMRVEAAKSRMEAVGENGIWVNTSDIPAEETQENLNHGWLGVKVYDIDTNAIEFNMPKGAYVSEVTAETGAEAAGMQPYDIITKLNETDIYCVQDLLNAIATTVPGDKVTVKVLRLEGEEFVPVTMEVTMSEDPELEIN